MPGNAALILSAGSGLRAGGGLAKQYRHIGGQSILRRSMELFLRPDIAHLQVVIGEHQAAEYQVAAEGLNLPKPIIGGATRRDSARLGLEALEFLAPDKVLIHDAARPLTSPRLIGDVLAAIDSGHQAAIPLLPVADTLKKQNDSGQWETIARDGLYRAQTPQGFSYSDILDAHRRFSAEDVTDDMQLAERAGLKIATVAGDETNMKITTGEDFAVAQNLLGARQEFRTGSGFDAHRFATGDHVWLCGIKIPHTQTLLGHSDADAGLHALTDALLSAIGAGDIGQHFPPTDEKWRGASSDRFLEHANTLLKEAGATVVNCDVTLVCERPKIAPYREAMRNRVAEILKINVSRVSVKATTTEGMGFAGRGEGIAAQAVASVRLG